MKRLMIVAAMIAVIGSTAQAQYLPGVSTPQTCAGGRCGPVQQAAHATVSYVGNVANAVLAPVLPQRVEYSQPVYQSAPVQACQPQAVYVSSPSGPCNCRPLQRIARFFRCR